MDEILVKATVNALGLRRGDIAKVTLGPTADAMVANGFWIWLDAPEPVIEVTEVVKERKPRAKKVVAAAEPVNLNYMTFPEASTADVWADEGGYLPGDGTDTRLAD